MESYQKLTRSSWNGQRCEEEDWKNDCVIGLAAILDFKKTKCKQDCQEICVTFGPQGGNLFWAKVQSSSCKDKVACTNSAGANTPV